MKTLSISALVVAGFLVAFGSGVMGRYEGGKADNVSLANASTGKIAGSCCGSSANQVQVTTDAPESCCGSSTRNIQVATSADGQSSCCQSKAANVLTTTDGAEKKECGSGGCCQSKAANVLTTTDATEKKECGSGGCCQSKAANVLTTTDATEKKECGSGGCCQSKAANVLTTTDATEKKECDGKDCKPTGECCEARKANVLTSTDGAEKKECAAGGCCQSKQAGVLTSTPASDEKKCEEGKCADGTCPSQCPVTTAMAKLPKMTYTVGTEQVCCPDQAKALAEQHKAPVVYVVAEKTYECPTAAMTALVEETESFVTAFTAPKKCEASGNTVIAGKAIACPVDAEKHMTLVSTAIANVKMEYEVAGEKAACASCAATQAKEKSAAIEYVVGEEKTTCQMTARMSLARAKYKAAVQALAAQAVSTEATAG